MTSRQNPAYRSSLDFLAVVEPDGAQAIAKGSLASARTIHDMDYFRQRARPAAIGLVIGLLIGWFQPLIWGVAIPASKARVFLTLQMGLAFMLVAIFVAHYLEMRRRMYAKIKDSSNP